MEIDSSWAIFIAKVQNGYIISFNDEDDQEKSYMKTEVFEETDELDELEVMKSLFYWIKEHFGVYYNKHGDRNLIIQIENIKDEAI